MSSKHLPYGRQFIDESDIQAVTEVLRSDFLTTGPKVDEFEAEICKLAGSKHAIAVNSGTAALHVAYFAAGIGHGDEIITSPLSFVATANAAMYLGAQVRFADIDPSTGNIDPQEIRKHITAKTKAIVAVDFTGRPANYDEIRKICLDHKLTLIADAAHSFGATYKGRPVGSLADITALSFHPVKPITTGEGGAVVTHVHQMAHRAKRFRTHGISREPSEMNANEGPWSYDMIDLGFNYRLTDIQCALGLSQLKRLKPFIERRQKIAQTYFEAFKGLSGITLPAPDDETYKSGWHLFVLRMNEGTAKRKEVFLKLRELNLGVQVHYRPIYLQSFYQKMGYPKGLCPQAERYYEAAISLPIYPLMSDADIESSITRIRQVLAGA